MKKTWKVIISTLLTIIAISAFFALAFLLPIPLGEPMIDIELAQSPPWQVSPGRNIQAGLSITNKAWLLATAKDLHIIVTTPEDLTVSGADANGYKRSIGNLRGGETVNLVLNMTANIDSLPGTYTLTIEVSGQNAPTKTLTPDVLVQLPPSH